MAPPISPGIFKKNYYDITSAAKLEVLVRSVFVSEWGEGRETFLLRPPTGSPILALAVITSPAAAKCCFLLHSLFYSPDARIKIASVASCLHSAVAL